MSREFGRLLRDMRKERGATLQHVKDETGFSVGLLSRVERGEREPSRKLVVALADYFGVREEDLLTEAALDRYGVSGHAGDLDQGNDSIGRSVLSDRIHTSAKMSAAAEFRPLQSGASIDAEEPGMATATSRSLTMRRQPLYWFEPDNAEEDEETNKRDLLHFADQQVHMTLRELWRGALTPEQKIEAVQAAMKLAWEPIKSLRRAAHDPDADVRAEALKWLDALDVAQPRGR